MDSLPSDLILRVLAFLNSTDLSRLSSVSRQHYLFARHALYANLTINFFQRGGRALKLLSTLGAGTSPFNPTLGHPASAVRHLAVVGAAMADEAQLVSLRNALAQMARLLSLELAIKTFPHSIAKTLFTEDILKSSDFLPELLALKSDDAEVVSYLVPGRPVYSVFVDDIVPSSQCLSSIQALSMSTQVVTQLQLRMEVHDSRNVSETMAILTAHFPTLSTLCIEFDLLSPSERPLSWASVKDMLTRMGPSLSSMHGLHSLSMCFYPEPFAREKEAMAAMDICRGFSNTLMWLELGWHVWTPDSGHQPMSSRHQLLRRRWAFSRPAAA